MIRIGNWVALRCHRYAYVSDNITFRVGNYKLVPYLVLGRFVIAKVVGKL